jgi:hypothetical protein
MGNKMVDKSVEWTPEMATEIERKEKLLREALPLFWAALIPTYFALQTVDRLMSLIFGVGISYTNVPPYLPILIQFSSPLAVLMFLAVYYHWTLGEKRDAVLWYLSVVIILTPIMVLGEMGAHPEGFPYGPWVWFGVELPLVQLGLCGPSLLIAVAKSAKRRALTVAVTAAVTVLFVAFFAIVHWVFWLPNFPDFTWKGIQGPVAPGNLVLYYSTVLGPIAIGAVIAMHMSKKLRIRIVTHEMKEPTAK